MPLGFGPHGGQIWVADEDGNAVHAVKNNGPPGPGPYTVFPNILSHVGAEGVFVIPDGSVRLLRLLRAGAFFQAVQQMLTNRSGEYPLTDFTCPLQGWVATFSLRVSQAYPAQTPLS